MIVHIIINISFERKWAAGKRKYKMWIRNKRRYGLSNQNIVDRRRRDEISAHQRQRAFFTLAYLFLLVRFPSLAPATSISTLPLALWFISFGNIFYFSLPLPLHSFVRTVWMANGVFDFEWRCCYVENVSSWHYKNNNNLMVTGARVRVMGNTNGG